MKKTLGVMIAFVAVTLSAYLLAFKPLIGINAGDLNCNTAPTLVAIPNGDGFSSVTLTNDNTDIVYLGGSAVSGTSNGYPICSGASCKNHTLTVDTYRGELYCFSGGASFTTIHTFAGH